MFRLHAGNHPLLIVAVLLRAATLAAGQGFTVGSDRPASVNESDLFVSIDGRFSIALPRDFHGFTPMSSNTPAGKITGDSYDWPMKQGHFTAGYIDRPELLEEPAAARRMLDFMRDRLIERAKPNQGNFTGERNLSGSGHPARELRIEFSDGLFIQRIILVDHRMYLVSVVLHTDQRSEEGVAEKILDSFKILSAADLDVAAKKLIADATPSPLPQAPIAPRAGSDAKDERLKNKVKTVFTETEDLSGTWAVSGRKPESMEYFDGGGNLTKKESYDWKGNLRDIEVFGFIDGERVSQSGHIRHEYDPPPMAVGPATGEKPVERDRRYQTKYRYKYDAKARLVEREVFGNDGKLRIKCVREYEAAKEFESCYSDGKVYYKTTSVFDDKGNEVEKATERPSTRTGEATGDKYTYAYEFDGQQNWTKRTTAKWVTKNGRSFYEPAYTDYRTIIYY